MLNLFDYLTEEDNRKIENYIYSYAVSKDCYAGNEEYLSYWAENNKKLFHLLGGNLIYKKPYEYTKSEDAVLLEIRHLMYPSSIIGKSDFDKIFDYIYNNLRENSDLIRQFRDENIYCNNKTVYEIKLTKDDAKDLKIPAGCKPIRALQKILTYLKAPQDMFEALEKFRIALSMIMNDKKVKGTLCLSIHPLDFMTMSDNANDWQSCMSWVHEGCYRLGTVEMMNSNNVICAYIENENNSFEYGRDEYKDTWNNKKWRQLFYCTKEIIVSGKSYPYYNEQITKDIVQILRTLAFENWKHTYEFGIERYKDMIHLGSLYRIENNRHWIRTKTQAKKHNIIFDSKAMYNDMFNDNNYGGYWCVRNKVKKNTIISYSGKAPCLCCMETVTTPDHQYNDYEEEAYNNRYDNADSLVCSKCIKGHICDNCGRFFKTLYDGAGYNYKYCEECWKIKMKKCPLCHKVMNLSCVSSNWMVDIPNFNICDDCLEHFENFPISKFFCSEGYSRTSKYWKYSRPEDFAQGGHLPKEFDLYKRENLESLPLPT